MEIRVKATIIATVRSTHIRVKDCIKITATVLMSIAKFNKTICLALSKETSTFQEMNKQHKDM